MSEDEEISGENKKKGRNFFDDDESLKLSGTNVSFSSAGLLKSTLAPRPSTAAKDNSGLTPDLPRLSQNSGAASAPSARPSITVSSGNASVPVARPSVTPISASFTTESTGRASASSVNQGMRENHSFSSLPVGDSPSRPLTAMAQSQALMNSLNRKQSFMSAAQPVTNPVEAVRLLLNCDPEQQHRRDSPFVCLEHFRSFAAKRKLLSAALATHDGNVILTVLRFLRSTLSFDLFVTVLQSDPDAARQYLIYLKQCNNTAEVNALFARLETVDSAALDKNQIEGATKLAAEMKQRAILDRFAAITVLDPDRRKDAYYKFSRDESGNSSLAEYAKKTAILLEIQQKLDSVEAVDSRSSNFVYSEFPLAGSIVGRTIGETLRHVAVYHLTIDPNICPNCEKKEPPIHLNAACLKKTFNVSDKVFQMAMTRALTQSRRYELIDKVLAPKGIASIFSSSSKKVKPAVAPERVIDVIMYTLKQWNRLGMSLPPNIRSYLQYIDDPDIMESIARDHQLYDIVTEVYCQRKDRHRLMAYIASMPSNHPEYERAKYRSIDPSIKWKN